MVPEWFFVLRPTGLAQNQYLNPKVRFLSKRIGICIVFFLMFCVESFSGELIINEPENGRIIQRQKMKGTLELSGLYSGRVKPIEYRIVYDGTDDPVSGHNWTLLDVNVSGQHFRGNINGIPQGGWYNVDVRVSDLSSEYKGKNKWGVGVLIGIIGQSNAQRWFWVGSGQKANKLLRKYNEKGWAELGKGANGAVAFGNAIIDSMGIPVGLLDYGRASSLLTPIAEPNWANYSGDPYASFIAGVNNLGGALEFIVWIQGESDAGRGVLATVYYSNLAAFIEKVRQDLKNFSERTDLPFIVSLLGVTKKINYENNIWQGIRNAQANVEGAVRECYIGATTIDLEMEDDLHFSGPAYLLHGQRMAKTVLHLLGKAEYYRGPRILSESLYSNSIIEIRLQHNGGNDFVPQNGISGFEVFDNGKPVKIVSAYRYNSSTIHLLLASAVSDNHTVRYLYGKNPLTDNIVYDNSDMKLPLEGNPNIIKSLPIPTLYLKQ